MSLTVNVNPYALEGMISGDNYFTHYKARGDDNEEFHITEFFPSYMAQRDEETGELVVSETFANEFTEGRLEFIRRAEEYEKIRDASLHPIVEVFQRNNTAYVVRRVCMMTTVESYMGGQQMDFDEAFHFIRPALLSLAQAAEQKIMFNLSIKDFRVNHFKQLVSCGLPTWDTDFHPTLKQIAKLYYKLVTGVEAAETNTPGFAIYGLTVPPRIESIILEVLNGEILYGSLYDFFKQFKALIEGSSDTPQGDGKTMMKILRVAAAVLSVALIISSVFLVRNAVRTYRAETFWTNPGIFADPLLAEAPPYDFSQITLTHPTNNMDAISGTFGQYDGFMFFRDSAGIMRRRVEDMMVIPGAMGVLAVHDDTIVLRGVRPAFFTGYDGFVYFVDTSSDSAIYRMRVNGDEFERVSDFAALNLAVVGSYLYFTRPDTNNHLFRKDLESFQEELVLPMPVFATLVDEDSRLLIMAGEPNTENSGLYVLDFENYEITPIAGGVGGVVRHFLGRVYYLDMQGRINVIREDGEHLGVLAPTNVKSFDVFFQWVVFTEEGRHVPRAYNMNNGRFFTLSSTEWLSYVWVREETVFGLDHRNPNIVHSFNLPM